jgi:hypothetical protein
MNTWLMLLGVSTLVMLAVTWHARRLGNEPRDVALLGGISAAMGMGTAVGFAV